MYYEVLASSKRYHGTGALTYSYSQKLSIGSLVKVPLRNDDVVGIVVDKVTKPAFATKPVTEVLAFNIIPKTSLELLNWLQAYYPASLGSIVAQFLPSGLDKSVKDNENDENLTKPITLPPLTSEQSNVINRINKSGTFLLHGDTGTGKTRVYIELAKQELISGKDVLILTPEISLTPQLVSDFQSVFGSKVIVIHSSLTGVERRKAWLDVLKSTKPVIVIGPRSALFAPFKNLGLIVADEAHDNAYKQEQAPYYHGLRVAGQLAKINSAKLVMGSATPSVTDYFVAEAKNIPILRMTKLAKQSEHAKANIQIIDSTNRKLFTKNHYLSDDLLKAIGQTLSSGNQALIFLNRRGTARLVACQNCGWQALCPNCNLPLTYHGDEHIMRCHTCGFKDSSPTICPICKSSDIIYKSAGTKTIIELLKSLFPDAKTQRFDGDNKKAERFEQHYKNVQAGKVDIIVGTQILTKGLDLPKLGLVGVVNADSSLAFPDYTAGERTFQLLSQIIGRVGRGHAAGKAIVQTFQPGNESILAAINKDWQGFYETEVKYRQLFTFPPYCFVLKLNCVRKTQKSAQQTSVKLVEDLRQLKLPIEVVGPSPGFFEKSKNGYSWQIIVKSKSRDNLLEIINKLPAGWNYDIDPTSLL